MFVGFETLLLLPADCANKDSAGEGWAVHPLRKVQAKNMFKLNPKNTGFAKAMGGLGASRNSVVDMQTVQSDAPCSQARFSGGVLRYVAEQRDIEIDRLLVKHLCRQDPMADERAIAATAKAGKIKNRDLVFLQACVPGLLTVHIPGREADGLPNIDMLMASCKRRGQLAEIEAATENFNWIAEASKLNFEDVVSPRKRKADEIHADMGLPDLSEGFYWKRIPPSGVSIYTWYRNESGKWLTRQKAVKQVSDPMVFNALAADIEAELKRWWDKNHCPPDQTEAGEAQEGRDAPDVAESDGDEEDDQAQAGEGDQECVDEEPAQEPILPETPLEPKKPRTLKDMFMGSKSSTSSA